VEGLNYSLGLSTFITEEAQLRSTKQARFIFHPWAHVSVPSHLHRPAHYAVLY